MCSREHVCARGIKRGSSFSKLSPGCLWLGLMTAGQVLVSTLLTEYPGLTAEDLAWASEICLLWASPYPGRLLWSQAFCSFSHMQTLRAGAGGGREKLSCSAALAGEGGLTLLDWSPGSAPDLLGHLRQVLQPLSSTLLPVKQVQWCLLPSRMWTDGAHGAWCTWCTQCPRLPSG